MAAKTTANRAKEGISREMLTPLGATSAMVTPDRKTAHRFARAYCGTDVYDKTIRELGVYWVVLLRESLPVCQMCSGNCALSVPAITSSAACTMSRALAWRRSLPSA